MVELQLLWLVVIIGVLGGFLALVYYTPQQDPRETINDSARQLITQFTKSGEYIGFDQDPTPPVTKYTYKPVEKTRTITYPNGTTLNKTETVYEQAPVESSTISVDVQDRVLKQAKICKMGYQCDITGTINLIDPITQKRIIPPYAYLITLDCDYRTDCALSPSLNANDATYPDGSFRYTWIPTPQIKPGEYRATVYVTSHYTNENGENERRIGIRTIEVVN